MKDPASFCKTLNYKFKFKLKGDGPIAYHLGMNYIRDKDGVLRQQPIQYIDKMFATYNQLFKSIPKKYKFPLEKGDHPEIDNSEYLDEQGIKHYLTIIGQLQWCISLGRLDIFSDCVTMSSFRIMPRIGHMERLKRISRYLYDTK